VSMNQGLLQIHRLSFCLLAARLTLPYHRCLSPLPFTPVPESTSTRIWAGSPPNAMWRAALLLGLYRMNSSQIVGRRSYGASATPNILLRHNPATQQRNPSLDTYEDFAGVQHLGDLLGKAALLNDANLYQARH
jgi:hypothetical protein